jgi:uncharacterized membrane protein
MDTLTWVLVGLVALCVVISVLEVHIKRRAAQRELLPGGGYDSRARGESLAA